MLFERRTDLRVTYRELDKLPVLSIKYNDFALAFFFLWIYHKYRYKLFCS